MKRLMLCALLAAATVGFAVTQADAESFSSSFVETGPGGNASASSSSDSYGARTWSSGSNHAIANAEARSFGRGYEFASESNVEANGWGTYGFSQGSASWGEKTSTFSRASEDGAKAGSRAYAKDERNWQPATVWYSRPAPRWRCR